MAKKGNGTIQFIDNLTIKGTGTNFTKILKQRDSIKASTPKNGIEVAEQIVAEVISDTEMKLKEPGAMQYDPEVKYNYKSIPKVDQSDVFNTVYDVLKTGGSIAMFPEGGSHD